MLQQALVIFKRNPTLTFPTRVTRNPTWTFNGQCSTCGSAAARRSEANALHDLSFRIEDADSRENRQLTLALYEENMTWEICTAACDARGNDLAGIELYVPLGVARILIGADFAFPPPLRSLVAARSEFQPPSLASDPALNLAVFFPLKMLLR